mmetsp:Transcript_30343/g.68029  ORF Transcript_30343/g.68029 Transcript_30343/m.68029 type:complete len:261 (-) Transcript_30343:323-1105(-)
MGEDERVAPARAQQAPVRRVPAQRRDARRVAGERAHEAQRRGVPELDPRRVAPHRQKRVSPPAAARGGGGPALHPVHRRDAVAVAQLAQELDRVGLGVPGVHGGAERDREHIGGAPRDEVEVVVVHDVRGVQDPRRRRRDRAREPVFGPAPPWGPRAAAERAHAPQVPAPQQAGEVGPKQGAGRGGRLREGEDTPAAAPRARRATESDAADLAAAAAAARGQRRAREGASRGVLAGREEGRAEGRLELAGLPRRRHRGRR